MKKKCNKKKYKINFGQNGLDNLPKQDPNNMDLMDFLMQSFNKRYNTDIFDDNSFSYQTTPKRETSFDSEGNRILDPLYEYNINEKIKGKRNAMGEGKDINFSSLRYFGDRKDPNDPNKIQSIYDVDEITTTYGPRGQNKYSNKINPLIDAVTYGANSITDMKQRRNQMRKRTELMQGSGSYNLGEYGTKKAPAYFQTGGETYFQKSLGKNYKGSFNEFNDWRQSRLREGAKMQDLPNFLEWGKQINNNSVNNPQTEMDISLFYPQKSSPDIIEPPMEDTVDMSLFYPPESVPYTINPPLDIVDTSAQVYKEKDVSSNKLHGLNFKSAYKKAAKEGGAGSTFDWRGKKYIVSNPKAAPTKASIELPNTKNENIKQTVEKRNNNFLDESIYEVANPIAGERNPSRFNPNLPHDPWDIAFGKLDDHTKRVKAAEILKRYRNKELLPQRTYKRLDGTINRQTPESFLREEFLKNGITEDIFREMFEDPKNNGRFSLPSAPSMKYGGYRKFQNAGENDKKEVKQKETPTRILNFDWDGDYFMQRYEVDDPRYVWKQDEGGDKEKAGIKTLQHLLNQMTPEQQKEAFKTLNFTTDRNSDYFVDLPPGVPEELETRYRRIDMFNADGTVKEAFARARESKNRDRIVTGGGFLEGSAGDNDFIDLSGLLIDRSVELPTYSQRPPNMAPIPKGPTNTQSSSKKPTTVKPTETKKEEVQTQPLIKSELPKFPATTRDNTRTQANEFRAADGSLYPREIQDRIQADNLKNRKVSNEILIPVYNEDGSIREYEFAQDWNGIYENDFLNWGDSPTNKGNPSEDSLVLFLAATLATRGLAALPALMTRLGSMGIRGKQALDLVEKGKKASTLVKKPAGLNPEVIIPKPAGLLNKGKTVIDIKPVPPKALPSPKATQLPPSRVPPSRRLPGVKEQPQFSIDPRQLPTRPGSPAHSLPYSSSNPKGFIIPRTGVGFQQGGYNEGEEVDLSPEEVAMLIELGYDFEVI